MMQCGARLLLALLCWCVLAPIQDSAAQENPFYSILRWPPTYKAPPDPRPWWEQAQLGGQDRERGFLQQTIPPRPREDFVWDGNQNAWLPPPEPDAPCSEYVAPYDVRACIQY